jgi:hypothetical protein
MSQVVIQNDRLQVRRLKTKVEEEAIVKDLYYGRFRKNSDATKTTSVERVLGLVAIPILLFWGLLAAVLSLGVGFSISIFRLVGEAFKGKKA